MSALIFRCRVPLLFTPLEAQRTLTTRLFQFNMKGLAVRGVPEE
ncbi:hypothetical protein [Metallosphaera javensis (ex Hofmann et al. 2022)]|nr:hypothetical protein [Metallosphaera javensis (ex Hofmann et al. 2022)]